MFFSILKFWFSGLSGGWKGKKWPKMTKNSPSLTCISGTVHPMIVIFGTHVWNDDIFSKFFQYSKFWFWGFYEGKRAKDGLKLSISVCFALHLRNCRSCRSYNQDFDNDMYRCFSLIFFKYNIVNIKIILPFIDPLQLLF